MATAQAEAKLDPAIAGLHAILTYILFCGLDLDLVQMIAAFGHIEALSSILSGRVQIGLSSS